MPPSATATQTAETESRSIKEYIPSYLRPYVHPYQGDFCFTQVFHPAVIAQLMMEGFLPIACPDVCLPKLHEQRSVICPLTNLHVSKSSRKKAKQFRLSMNQDFDNVVRLCRTQHGENCWLYPKLTQAFRTIHKRGDKGYSSKFYPCTVRLYSIEVWNEEDDLVAGEIGYSVGAMYTSLTGFSIQDSSGSVQLAALGRLLQQNQFEVWDLGMDMAYKQRLGCQLMPREQFVQTVRNVRERDVHLVCDSQRNCRNIIDDVMEQDRAEA